MHSGSPNLCEPFGDEPVVDINVDPTRTATIEHSGAVRGHVGATRS